MFTSYNFEKKCLILFGVINILGSAQKHGVYRVSFFSTTYQRFLNGKQAMVSCFVPLSPAERINYYSSSYPPNARLLDDGVPNGVKLGWTVTCIGCVAKRETTTNMPSDDTWFRFNRFGLFRKICSNVLFSLFYPLKNLVHDNAWPWSSRLNGF